MAPVMRAYVRSVSIRRLLALFVAVAVLFAPALTRAGAAFAAVPDHQMQMMAGGHCASPPSAAAQDASAGNDEPAGDHHKPPGHDKAGGKNCCISMCMAVALPPPRVEADVAAHGTTATYALVNQYQGRITEIATPPPRLA